MANVYSSVHNAHHTLVVYNRFVDNIIRKESKLNRQELRLSTYKGYNDSNDSFYIGFAIQGIEEYTNITGQLGRVPWDELMWDWTAKHWSLLFLLILYEFNLPIKSVKTITWCFNHKVQRFTAEAEYLRFIADLTSEAKQWRNTVFCRLEKSRKYKFVLEFALLRSFYKDVSLSFDSERWKATDLPILQCMECQRGERFGWDFLDKMKNKTQCPSHTFYMNSKASIVVDYDTNTMHKGHKRYITHRLMDTLTEIERTDRNFVDFVNYCATFIYYAVSLYCAPNDFLYSNQELDFVDPVQIRWEYNNFIFPVKMRRMYFRYYRKCEPLKVWSGFIIGSSCLLPKDDKFRRNCMVCDAVQKFDDTTVECNKKYVDKMYHCRCGLLFVCSKRCQKKSWSKKPWMHRVSCRKKRL
eukprot:107205_1